MVIIHSIPFFLSIYKANIHPMKFEEKGIVGHLYNIQKLQFHHLLVYLLEVVVADKLG